MRRKGRAGRMCIGKNVEEKNGGMACQDSEKTERCGMEEELLCRGSSTAWVMEPERKASTQELCLDLILLETSFSRF